MFGLSVAELIVLMLGGLGAAVGAGGTIALVLMRTRHQEKHEDD